MWVHLWGTILMMRTSRSAHKHGVTDADIVELIVLINDEGDEWAVVHAMPITDQHLRFMP